MNDPSCDCGACCTQCGHTNDCTSQQPDDDWLPNGGHDSDCAYVAGISRHCTCPT